MVHVNLAKKKNNVHWVTVRKTVRWNPVTNASNCLLLMILVLNLLQTEVFRTVKMLVVFSVMVECYAGAAIAV